MVGVLRVCHFAVSLSRWHRVNTPNQAWLHPERMTAQPSSQALWNVAFPTIMPTDLSCKMVPELLYIAGIWWRDEVDRLEANARLGLVLARMVRQLTADAVADTNSQTFLSEATMVVERILDRRVSLEDIGNHLQMSGRSFGSPYSRSHRTRRS